MSGGIKMENLENLELESIRKNESFLVTLVEDSEEKKVPFDKLDKNSSYKLEINFTKNFKTEYKQPLTFEEIDLKIKKFGKNVDYIITPSEVEVEIK